MSTPRHPNRLKEYASDKTYYPRELVESNGILYLIGDDGVAVKLNEKANTAIKDSSGASIGTVNPVSGGTITIPAATTSKFGLVKLGTKSGSTAGTAAPGTSTLVAREDHVHPAQTTITGNAGSATKLQSTRTITITGDANADDITATGASFNGSANATIKISAIKASIVSGLATVATSGKYSDLTGTPTVPDPAGADDTPKAAGTAAVGTSTKYAKADHVHPIQTTVSGNAGSATKLATARTIGLSGVTATAQSFNGTASITIPITAVPASIVTGLATVAKTGNYNDLTGVPSIPEGSDDKPAAAGTADAGEAITWARADHVHPAQTSVSGNAGTATKLATARTITVAGPATGDITATGASFNGAGDATIKITGIKVGLISGLATVATSGSYTNLNDKPTIPSAAGSSDTPVAAGTAKVGDKTTYARADHVHPAQTSVSGNAGTATKLATARTIALSGAATGTATSFNGSANITIPVTALDGSKITGTIPLSSIPKGAQERLIPVATDTARLALTTDDAQNGDVVKVQDTGIMYYVVDDTKLGSSSTAASAFEVFTAGAASSVDWAGITNKPSFATVATSGSYTDLKNKPTIPSAAGSSDTPAVAGTAKVGDKTTYARADHVHPAQTSVSGNAGTATKLATARTIGLSGVTATAQSFNGTANITIPITAVPASIVTGLATVAKTGAYSDLSGKPTTGTSSVSGLTKLYTSTGTATDGTMTQAALNTALAGKASSSHSHDIMSITVPSTAKASAGSVPVALRSMVSGNAPNVTAFLPKDQIVVEYTTDGGTTWSEYKLDDAKKLALFAESTSSINVGGPNVTKDTVTANCWTRVTIEPKDRYANAQFFYCWFSTNGNSGCTVDIERSTIDAKDTFTSVATGLALSGWSGPNICSFPYGTFGGGATQNSNAYKYRFTFKVKTATAVSTVGDLRMYGYSVWTAANSYMKTGHPYSVATNMDVTFPKHLTATGGFTGALTGNASTATKLATARTITVSGVTATGASFDGSGNATIAITAVPASIVSGLHKVATSGKYSDLTGTPTIPGASSTTPKVAGTASAGSEAAWARGDHVHPVQTSVSGNAGTATKLATARTITVAGSNSSITATGASFDGSGNATITISAIKATVISGLATVAKTGAYSDLSGKPSLAAVATSGKYSDLDGAPSIPAASSSAPSAPAATASAGSATTYARGDHKHPLQTTVSGNAGTATKLAAGVNIGLSGVTATAQSFDGSKAITIPITAVPVSIVTGLHKVATSGKYSDLTGTPTIPGASTTTPKVAGTAAVGSESAWARGDHVHPVQTSVSGNAGSATRLQTARTINGTSFNGTANITITADPKDNTLTANKDLNTVEDQGFYTGTTFTNGPTGLATTGFSLLVMYNGNDYTNQIICDNTNKMYIRTATYSGSTATWGAWQPIYNAANPSPHPIITTSSNTTTTSTPNAGGTFTAIDSVTKDANGHVTTYRTKTITMPTNAKHGIGFGTCGTASSTSAKAVSCSNFVLQTGGIIAIRFTYAVTGSMTLNVNSTGAKTAYISGGTAFTPGVIKAGDIGTFVYNGSYYFLMSVSTASKTYTANVSTTWTGTEAPYTQTISVVGMTSNDNPIVDVVPSTTFETAKTQISEYGKIYKITTSTDSITVYATEKTEEVVPIQLKCVK